MPENVAANRSSFRISLPVPGLAAWLRIFDSSAPIGYLVRQSPIAIQIFAITAKTFLLLRFGLKSPDWIFWLVALLLVALGAVGGTVSIVHGHSVEVAMLRHAVFTWSLCLTLLLLRSDDFLEYI